MISGILVMFGKYAGHRFKYGDAELRIMNDDEILGIDYFINTKHENPQKAYVDLFELTGVEYEVYGDSLVIKEQK